MSERSNVGQRTFTFDLEGRAREDGGIPIVVSTDAVVDMPDGPEILLHTAEAIDLRRAPLPIIASHQGGQVNVGIVDGLAPVNGQLRGYAKFGSRPEAAGYHADVEAGIIRSVSAGYARIKGVVRKDGVLVTTRWMPTHAAMVAEPADVRAGFYRERTPAFELTHEEVSTPPAGNTATPGVPTMDNQNSAPAGVIPAPAAQAPTRVEVVADHGNRPLPLEMERQRKTAIQNLCRANKLDERYERHWIETGADFSKVSEELVNLLEERGRNTPAASVGHLGLDSKDVRRYSLMRALRAAQNRDWKNAGLELEANNEISKRMNRLPKSDTAFFVPLDVMLRQRQQRDMTVAGASGSQYLVGTDNMPGSFIELLRNTSVALRMGVRRMGGLVGNVTIPKMTAGNTAYWLSDENTAITESQPTIGQLSLMPKNVAALTELSHQLMQQSTPDAEQMVFDSIARDIGLAVDVGILRGSGASGQPAGIVGSSGIGSVTGTSLASAGILDAQADVAGSNALYPGCGYVTTPAVAALLMNRPDLVTTGTTPLWTGNMLQGQLKGFPAMSSNQMASATMLFGWWDSVILAEWGVLELMTNPYSDFTRGLTAVRGWYTCDVGVRYGGAFTYASSIT
jgi:HK97 family phage major capsid protein